MGSRACACTRPRSNFRTASAPKGIQKPHFCGETVERVECVFNQGAVLSNPSVISTSSARAWRCATGCTVRMSGREHDCRFFSFHFPLQALVGALDRFLVQQVSPCLLAAADALDDSFPD